MKKVNRIRLMPFGTLGGFIPYIVKIYNEVDQFAFVFQCKYLIVFAIFGLTAAIVVAIYPYGRPTVQIPVHRGQSFQSIADSVPVIADSF